MPKAHRGLDFTHLSVQRDIREDDRARFPVTHEGETNWLLGRLAASLLPPEAPGLQELTRRVVGEGTSGGSYQAHWHRRPRVWGIP